MTPKTVLFCLNDADFDLPRLVALARASGGLNDQVAYVSSEKKKRILKQFGVGTILLITRWRKLFFVISGLTFFAWYLCLPSTLRRNIYHAFILNQRPRYGSVRHVPIVVRIKHIPRFVGFVLFSIGLVRSLGRQQVGRLIFEERTKLPEILVYYLLALSKKVELVQYTRGAIPNCIVAKKLSSEIIHHHPMGISRWNDSRRAFESDFINLSNQDIKNHDQFFDAMMVERYERNRWYNRNLIPMENRREKFALPPFDRGKRTILIAPHVFWDATFAYGENAFGDYCEWFDRIVEQTVRHPDVNFIFKVHPDLFWKENLTAVAFNHFDYILNAIADKNNCSIIPESADVRNLELLAKVDGVVTVRGTMGLEACCLGLPVMTGGTGRYSHLGFTIDVDSPDELEGCFIDLLSRSPSDEVRKRARFLFWTAFKTKHIAVEGLNADFDRTIEASDDDILAALDTNSYLGSPSFVAIASWINGQEPDLQLVD